MKNKRLLILIPAIVVLAVFLLVSACAKAPAPTATSTPKPAPAPSSVSSPTPSATPKPTTMATPTQVYELKYATHMPPGYVLVTGAITPFIQELESKSNGRIKVTVFYSESLGKNATQYDMVSKGIADLTWANPGNTPGRFPLTGILELCFAYKNTTAANLVVAKMQPFLEREYSDVKLLALGESGLFQMGFKNKRVVKLEDLKGLKLRSLGSVISNSMSLLGAVPVSLAAGEMYTAMERGTVDGLLLPFATWSGYKIEEVAKYALDAGGLSSPSIIWPMNKDKFNKLPPDLQKIVVDAAAKLPAYTGQTFDNEYAKARKMLETRGIEVTDLSTAELARWKQAVMPTYDSWITDTKKLGLPAEEAMAAFKKAVDEVNK